MLVICPLCNFHYESLCRKCPDCGQPNEACTSKFITVSIEIDECVVVPLRSRAKEFGRDECSIIQDAIEQWLDRNPSRAERRVKS